jgi:hypothetical protein
MRLVRCTIQPGLIESEKVAIIPTAEGGEEEVIVSSRVASQNAIRAAEVGRQGEKVLIELPRESTTGRWRLWVPAANVT